jgi:hypothetical protein
MKIFRFILSVGFSLSVILSGCTYSNTFENNFPINREKAIMIAAKNVPSIVIQEATLSAGILDMNWIIYF